MLDPCRLGGEVEVTNVGVGFCSCDAIDDGCRIIPRRADYRRLLAIENRFSPVWGVRSCLR